MYGVSEKESLMFRYRADTDTSVPGMTGDGQSKWIFKSDGMMVGACFLMYCVSFGWEWLIFQLWHRVLGIGEEPIHKSGLRS